MNNFFFNFLKDEILIKNQSLYKTPNKKENIHHYIEPTPYFNKKTYYSKKDKDTFWFNFF